MAEKVKAPTQKELYERIKVAMANDAEVVALCEKKIEQIAHKANSANSKKDEANEKVFNAIAEALNGSNGMRASEIHKVLAVADPVLTVQKVTAMLKKMVDNGEVVKTVEKKVATFALAPLSEG